MIRIGNVLGRNCSGVTRRELLQIGGAGLLGLTLGDAIRAEAAESAPEKRNCIFLWLDGGPSSHETFDPKPEAPIHVRGPYGAIGTNLPGVQFSGLLPMLAQRADRMTVIRSMSHKIDSHSPMPMMTASRTSRTSHGAVVTWMRKHTGNMPPYVHVGKPLPVGGGQLGPVFNPVIVKDPTGSKITLPDFEFPQGVNPMRFDRRRELLDSVDGFRRKVEGDPLVEAMSAYYQRAMTILTSSEVREAFDLGKEPLKLRERYGGNFFGQSCLLARRLVEAGTRFVQIKWYDGPAWNAWDTHGADTGGLVRMEQHLCPRFDFALSALLDDLERRGLLESTLVVAVGEFGRTHTINRLGGRDHWPHCFSAMMAGGGAPRGLVLGASDEMGQYVADRPVSPGDFAATLYRLLGINPNLETRLRPFIAGGTNVTEITGTA